MRMSSEAEPPGLMTCTWLLIHTLSFLYWDNANTRRAKRSKCVLLPKAETENAVRLNAYESPMSMTAIRALACPRGGVALKPA